VEVQVLNVQIPASFYQMNETNSVLNYTVSASNFTLTVPYGNYNGQTLITAMTSLFSANGHSVVITLNQATGVLNFNYSGTFSFLGTSSIRGILGFPTTLSSVSNNLTMTFPLNLIGQHKIIIYSQYLGTKNLDNFGGCLFTIPITQTAGSMIEYENVGGHTNFLTSQRIQQIDFQLKDELGNLYNLNGVNWSITLRFIQNRYYYADKKTFNDVLMNDPPE
jgi:hypothetical protein